SDSRAATSGPRMTWPDARTRARAASMRGCNSAYWACKSNRGTPATWEDIAPTPFRLRPTLGPPARATPASLCTPAPYARPCGVSMGNSYIRRTLWIPPTTCRIPRHPAPHRGAGTGRARMLGAQHAGPGDGSARPAQRVLVGLATYRERENLETLLPQVRHYAPHADVLVVDDNSPDGTAEYVRSLAASDPHFHL